MPEALLRIAGVSNRIKEAQGGGDGEVCGLDRHATRCLATHAGYRENVRGTSERPVVA
jgi:hypothetical protein